jgi:hypothetical protein
MNMSGGVEMESLHLNSIQGTWIFEALLITQVSAYQGHA